jgi:hypothetical protein
MARKKLLKRRTDAEKRWYNRDTRDVTPKRKLRSNIYERTGVLMMSNQPRSDTESRAREIRAQTKASNTTFKQRERMRTKQRLLKRRGKFPPPRTKVG